MDVPTKAESLREMATSVRLLDEGLCPHYWDVAGAEQVHVKPFSS